MSKFSALNRRYLRISPNTTLEVRIYLHPDLIPTFTDDLLKVLHPVRLHLTHVETDRLSPSSHNPETQRRKREKERQKAYEGLRTRTRIRCQRVPTSHHYPTYRSQPRTLPALVFLTDTKTRDFTFEEEGEDAKPTLKTDYTGFSIYGRSLCLVVDPPVQQETVQAGRRKKINQKGKMGIEEWFVNTRNDVPAIDDS